MSFVEKVLREVDEAPEATVPVAVVRPLIDEWIGRHDDAETAYSRLAAASGLTVGAWRKRLTDTIGETGYRGWWSFTEIDVADVDFLLVCAELVHVWHEELAPWSGLRSWLTCEDCGVDLDKENARPVELMRPDPGALHGWVWDSTKSKLVFRPRNARAGGRRYRVFDLCRSCAGAALARREGADRWKPPKRGGRPRLLDERQLRQAYLLYERGELSMSAIARHLHAAGHPGTISGLTQSLLYGWRRLRLPLRSRSEQVVLMHRELGHEIGRRARQVANKRRCRGTTTAAGSAGGKPCTQWAQAGSDYCWNHNTFGLVPRQERRVRCEAITQKGKRCVFSPVAGGTFCRLHGDPDYAREQAARLRRDRVHIHAT